MSGRTRVKIFAALSASLLLSACDEAQMPTFLSGSKTEAATDAHAPQPTGPAIERDVEAPEIFQASEKGLWDGRPSLGGVWVAHSEATDPERVTIRNQANGKSVIGALFRREREVPGPRFQVSSDAASALGMLAGAPVNLSVTAMRKEMVAPAAPTMADAPTGKLSAPKKLTQTKLDDPIAAAAAALDAAEQSTSNVNTQTAKAAPSPSALAKPFVQIGIFSIEKNAKNTAVAIRQAGMTPTIKPGKSNGKNYWRVIAGPAGSTTQRADLLKKVKSLGFTDAYFVSN